MFIVSNLHCEFSYKTIVHVEKILKERLKEANVTYILPIFELI